MNTTLDVMNRTDIPPSSRTRTDLEDNLDQMYMLFMGLFIQLMECGFAFLEAGVMPTNTISHVIIRNTLDACVAGVAYWLVGYAFAFGSGNNFIGWNSFALAEYPDKNLAHFFLQLVVAPTCSTIVSGAVVGRSRLVAYLIYSVTITGFIYPMVTRWVWNPEGWLTRGRDYQLDEGWEQIGFFDFSGSGAVHLCGGSAALVAAIILGPRLGRFDQGWEVPPKYKGHSVPYAGYGVLILLIGFMAFNAGSVMSVSKSGDGAAMSLSVVNTMISAGFAGYSSLFFRKFVFAEHKWSVFYTINGAVCGMAAISGGCNVVRPWGASVIGLVAGVVFNVTSWAVMKFGIDDPADSIGIHFAGGLWGCLAVAFLKYDTGILMAWDRRAGLILAWQLAGIFSIILWSGGLSLILFGLMKHFGVFRVPAEEEMMGLDVTDHNEPAYQIHEGCLTSDLIEKLTDRVLEKIKLLEKTGYVTADTPGSNATLKEMTLQTRLEMVPSEDSRFHTRVDNGEFGKTEAHRRPSAAWHISRVGHFNNVAFVAEDVQDAG